MSFNIRTQQRVGGKFVSPQPVLKYVHEELIKLWKASVGAFVLEATKHVNVDTGMSRASFLPLAANIKLAKLISADLAGKAKFPARTLEGDIIPGRPKSRTLGRELGESAYDLEFGTPQIPKFKFNFRIVIFQYRLNEYGLGNNRQHWRSLEKGREAFIDHFNGNFTKYVRSQDILNWLITGRVANGK